MLCKTFVSLALAASALANVFITNPVSSTVMTAGQQTTITWQDDGVSPTLVAFGVATVGIYTGNANQQTLLQMISTSTDVSAASSLSFTPSSSIGPDSSEYFIRVDSNNLKDATNSKNPAQAFSAKFTMTGMTGSFNSTLQAEIAGQSTAPIGGTPTSSLSATGTSSTSKSASSTSTTSSTANPSSTTSTGAAGRIGVTGITCFVGAGASLLGALIF